MPIKTKEEIAKVGIFVVKVPKLIRYLKFSQCTFIYHSLDRVFQDR